MKIVLTEEEQRMSDKKKRLRHKRQPIVMRRTYKFIDEIEREAKDFIDELRPFYKTYGDLWLAFEEMAENTPYGVVIVKAKQLLKKEIDAITDVVPIKLTHHQNCWYRELSQFNFDD